MPTRCDDLLMPEEAPKQAKRKKMSLKNSSLCFERIEILLLVTVSPGSTEQITAHIPSLEQNYRTGEKEAFPLKGRWVEAVLDDMVSLLDRNCSGFDPS